jgi:hypothetical protein
MAAASKKKESKELKALYVRLESINDLGRKVVSEKPYIIAVKDGGSYRLICPGERVGEGRIIYFLETKSISRYLVYLAEEESGEKVEMADDVTNRADHYKSERIPIIEIAKNPYSLVGKADLKGVKTVEVNDPSALARALINSMEEDEYPNLYSFVAGKERIIGTFSLLRGPDSIFMYSRVRSRDKFSRITYDYINDTLEYTNQIGGTSKISIPVINLAERPPFFKS